jgi:hypothetical protein
LGYIEGDNATTLSTFPSFHNRRKIFVRMHCFRLGVFGKLQAYGHKSTNAGLILTLQSLNERVPLDDEWSDKGAALLNPGINQDEGTAEVALEGGFVAVYLKHMELGRVLDVNGSWGEIRRVSEMNCLHRPETRQLENDGKRIKRPQEENRGYAMKNIEDKEGNVYEYLAD